VGTEIEPAPGCRRCPRLAAFRDANRRNFPNFHNAPVKAAGPLDARLVVVGLAPGLTGGNRTGRPFEGDHAGAGLRAALVRTGIDPAGARITNAVRCVPPRNRPLSGEIALCRPFLGAELAACRQADVILALGVVAHGAVVAALGLSDRGFPFAHGTIHRLPDGRYLASCYHCSRRTMNTGRLTAAMLDGVLVRVRHLSASEGRGVQA
jgi:uracil-DNA glycosylase family 4